MKNSRAGWWLARLQEANVSRVLWARNRRLEVQEIKENKKLPQPGTKQHLKYIPWAEQRGNPISISPAPFTVQVQCSHYLSLLTRTPPHAQNLGAAVPWAEHCYLIYWSSCVWLSFPFILFYYFFMVSSKEVEYIAVQGIARDSVYHKYMCCLSRAGDQKPNAETMQQSEK